jgi:hypothetical protein
MKKNNQNWRQLTENTSLRLLVEIFPVFQYFFFPVFQKNTVKTNINERVVILTTLLWPCLIPEEKSISISWCIAMKGRNNSVLPSSFAKEIYGSSTSRKHPAAPAAIKSLTVL